MPKKTTSGELFSSFLHLFKIDFLTLAGRNNSYFFYKFLKNKVNYGYFKGIYRIEAFVGVKIKQKATHDRRTTFPEKSDGKKLKNEWRGMPDGCKIWVEK